MFKIPRHFFKIGFNERILTANDFHECCKFYGIEVKLFTRSECSFYGAFIPATKSPTGKPIILLGGELNGVPLLITAFHELGHYFQLSSKSVFQHTHSFEGSEKYTFGNICKKEYQAHAIAACALLPKSFLGSKTFREIQKVRKFSKVERREWSLKKVKELREKYSEYTEEWLGFRLRVATTLNM